MSQKIVYLDTETTGLVPGQVSQLSYIIEDENGVKAKNFFFTVDSMEEGASRVTGKTVDDYKILSNGKTFWDYASEIFEDLNESVWVAHNIKFDTNFISMEFWRCGYTIKPLSSLCTMNYFKDIVKIPYKNNANKFKNPKLEELVDSFNIKRDEILKMTQQLYNTDDTNLYHDSRFDTTAMWIAVVLYRIKDSNDEQSLAWKRRFIGC